MPTLYPSSPVIGWLVLSEVSGISNFHKSDFDIHWSPTFTQLLESVNTCLIDCILTIVRNLPPNSIDFGASTYEGIALCCKVVSNMIVLHRDVGRRCVLFSHFVSIRFPIHHLHQAEICRTRSRVEDRNISVLASIPNEIISKTACATQGHFDLIHPEADSRREIL